MSLRDFFQLGFFLASLTFLTPILGSYITSVFKGRAWGLHIYFSPLERFFHKICGIKPSQEMTSRQYALSLLIFNIMGLIFAFALQMLQGFLPLNPQKIGAPSWDSALNTAVSFVTNTNWQGYAGENSMSYFTQMMALTVQNFLSAAVSLTVVMALIRGLVSRQSQFIGHFWVDLIRSVLYILLPLSFLGALFLMGQGVIQTFLGPLHAITLQGFEQIIPRGPVASQVAIKMLGTNGGGFFNANAAHPFENPTAFSNFIQMLMIFSIPAALTYTYGSMIGSKKHGWILYSVMLALFTSLTLISLSAEYQKNPALGLVHANMEGKETRFGIFGSVLFANVTTSASCGAVNALHSSLSPVSGGVALFNMMLGEVIFGGVGAGLYGMLLFILLTVFIAGLLVGRTPEYLGKKIEASEMKMLILAILAPCFAILLATGLACIYPEALKSVSHSGPHGFSEILYAFTSAAANNGSAFAGLSANTVFFNLSLASVMLVGRFAIIFPLLNIAGNLAIKKLSPVSSGTFQTDTPLFGALLLGVILIIGALTFVPALFLGPIVEHLLMLRGSTF